MAKIENFENSKLFNGKTIIVINIRFSPPDVEWFTLQTVKNW